MVNKIVRAIIVGALMGGGAVCFSGEGEVNADKCRNVPEISDGELKLVTKIIDGDTFLIEGGGSVRILGMDADEREHACYEPAKNRLEELILNKEIKLEKGVEDKDRWCRYLRHVFLGGQNLSLRLVKEGFVVARFSADDVKYRKEIVQAEKKARENKTGCKWGGEKIAEGKTKFIWEKLTPEKTGLNVIGACKTVNYYGKEMLVEGKLSSVYRSGSGTVFLNFGKSYPKSCFTAVVFSADQGQFVEGLEKHYSQKTVRIKGKIKKRREKPEIILKDPAQIEVGK